jgi:D-arabinose 1-dehydrogenase-like Zn-dependent alcohol dehydrogenase
MTESYRAVEVSAPGRFKLVERALAEPGPTQVRVRVEACGICHSDAAVVEGMWPGLQYPRVPGHEIVGRIDAVGKEVARFVVGQRVGIGWFGGECGTCESCRRGDFVNCARLIVPGVSHDGGFADVVIAEARALALIPDELGAVDAAPLMCAGVTTFNALRNAGLRAGAVVAVHGVGGLGHLGLQFARRMGFHTVAIARGSDKEPLARDLGAHDYIDSSAEDAALALQRRGGADAVLTTVASGQAMGPLVAGLKARGKLVIVGASSEPLQVGLTSLLFGSRRIQGEFIGTAIDAEDTLRFSARQNIRPMTEPVPIEKAAEAYAKMMRNEARFRMVLTFT